MQALTLFECNLYIVLHRKFEVRISFDVSYFLKKIVFFNIELNAQTGQIDIDLQINVLSNVFSLIIVFFIVN